MILLIQFTALIALVAPHNHSPEQIHISFGDNPLDIVVTWNTQMATPQPFVIFGIESTKFRQEGNTTEFIDGGREKRKQYVHRVRLSNLQPSQYYAYRCGSELELSKQHWFRTVPDGSNWSPRVAVYGDLGLKNAVSLPYLAQIAKGSDFHAFIHVGDIAYDMFVHNGKRGDQFMNRIEMIAAHVPYMVCPGNHENRYNFSHYRERFSMPGQSEGLYYSFNLGPAHFIGINTEAFYYLKYGMKLLTGMYDWLEKDLKEANSPENRSIRPWIITYGHRPMYCSNTNHKCGIVDSKVRVGLEQLGFGLEEMFNRYNVDLAIWGHEHSYERTWPVYNNTVRNGTFENPYKNPGGIVHITTGSAGCTEQLANFTEEVPHWSVKRLVHYGYSTLHIVNKTHLHVEEFAIEEEKKLVDDLWLIKETSIPAIS